MLIINVSYVSLEIRGMRKLCWQIGWHKSQGGVGMIQDDMHANPGRSRLYWGTNEFHTRVDFESWKPRFSSHHLREVIFPPLFSFIGSSWVCSVQLQELWGFFFFFFFFFLQLYQLEVSILLEIPCCSVIWKFGAGFPLLENATSL